MFFKNLNLFKLTREVKFSSKMEAEFSNYTFSPCGTNDVMKIGFIPPIPSTQPLFLERGNNVLFAVCKEEKIIPAQALRNRVSERVNSLEQSLGRMISKKEKNQIKDDEFVSMVKTAFTKIKTTYVWVNNESQIISIDSPSGKVCDEVLSLVRNALGSMPAVPVSSKTPPEITMTEWMGDGRCPENFAIGDGAIMKSALEHGGVITAKDQDLNADEIKSHLEADKLVTALNMKYKDDITFQLTSDIVVRKIKFSNEITGQNDDCESLTSKFDSDFYLMTETLNNFVGDLIDSLN